LAISTFIGLIAFRLFGWAWINPLTGFVVAIFAINEGREAWEGELLCESD
jgi:divalent metal cation (Fe/Co/Zn/Cd) transporter